MPEFATNSDRGPGVCARLGWFTLALLAVTPFLLSPSIGRADPLADADARQSASIQPASALATSVSGPTAIVTMQDDSPMYSPDSIDITVGQTIEWRNTGDVGHSVVDDPAKADRPGDVALPAGVKPFSSGNVMPGGSYRHTFTQPGEYRYFCWSHEADEMIGEVIVKPLPPSAAARVASQVNARPWSTRERQRDP